MKWLTNLFKKKQTEQDNEAKLIDDPKVQDHYKELSLIAADNARYLRALISTKRARINSLGKREAKKHKGEIEKWEAKLAEEEFYEDYFKNKLSYHGTRVQTQS